MGGKYDKKVMTVQKALACNAIMEERFANISPADQEDYLHKIGNAIPYIMPNPLSGEAVETSNGKMSKRCDNAVSQFRFTMCEFDTVSIEEQIAFWCGIRLPIIALISTGGKSIHAWIKVENINSLGQWQQEIKQGFYNIMSRYGVDKACSNPSRLSRLPGIIRPEKNQFQKLIYFNPKGTIL